jgi:hypothetical protein
MIIDAEQLVHDPGVTAPTKIHLSPNLPKINMCPSNNFEVVDSLNDVEPVSVKTNSKLL